MKPRFISDCFLLFSVVTVFFLASCAKEDPLKPGVNVNRSDWQSVPSSGGEVGIEDITLTFPSGAFDGNGQVAISKVKGNPFSDFDSCSQIYQVTLPSEGTKKKFTVSIAYDSSEEGELVMLVKTPTYSKHTGFRSESVFAIPFSKSGGSATATIPVAGESGSDSPYFSIGLARVYNSASTKAGGKYNYTYYNPYEGSAFYGSVPDNVQKVWALDNIIRDEYIPSAFSNLKSFGFELPSESVCFRAEYFSGDNASAWGFSESSAFFNEWGYIRINKKKLEELAQQSPYSEDLVGQIRQTLTHELFHTVHDWVYDVNRSPWERAKQGSEGDHWSMLSEAIGCWVEKATGNKMIGENCPAFADSFIKSFWPQDRSAAEYQNHGYGMGLFIEWLSRKTSNKKIVKLVEMQRAGETSLAKAFDSFLAAEKLSFFTPVDYRKFATSVISREFDKRVVTEDFAVPKGIAKNTFEITGDVYAFGTLVNNLGYTKAMVDNKSNEVLSIKLTQDREDVLSQVYLDNGKTFNYLGEFVKDKPLYIPFKSYSNSGSKYFTVITTRSAKEDKSGAMVSRIHCDLTFHIKSITYESGYTWLYWSQDSITVEPSGNNSYKVVADSDGYKITFTVSVSNSGLKDLTGVSVSGKYSGSTSVLSLNSVSDGGAHWTGNNADIWISF